MQQFLNLGTQTGSDARQLLLPKNNLVQQEQHRQCEQDAPKKIPGRDWAQAQRGSFIKVRQVQNYERDQRYQKNLKHNRLKGCSRIGSSRCEQKRRKENSKENDQCLRYWALGEKRHSKKRPPRCEA